MTWVYKIVWRIWDQLYLWLVPPYPTVFVKEWLPEQLKQRTLYVVYEDGFLEQAALLCPCGCRRTLHMNLIDDEHPCWTLIQNIDGTVTLNPSVWRKRDCRSHFWFRRSRVQWCRDEDRHA